MIKFFSIAALLLTSCGGLSDSKKLKDVDEDDAQKLCEEYDEEVTENCDFKGTNVPVTIGGSDCNIDGSGEDLPDGCEATVGDYRDCMDALMDDPCALIEGLPSECDWMNDCFEPAE